MDFKSLEALSAGTVYGSGSGSILLESVNCVGSEQRLLNCSHPFPVGISECSHAQDIGVACQPIIFPGICFQICFTCIAGLVIIIVMMFLS